MLLVAILLIFLTSSNCSIFHLVDVLKKHQALREDLETMTLHDNVINIVADIVKKTELVSVGIVTDSIYAKHVLNQNLVSTLDFKIIINLVIKDSESFQDEPSDEVQSQLIAMRDIKCDIYIILITNGIQMVDLLKYADYHRLLNIQAKVLMLHDYRLFTSEMHFIWKRIVNVVFIRKCDTKLRDLYELSTVPFPATIEDTFVAQIINFWTPPNRYRWKKSIFQEKLNGNLNGVKLKVAVLQHTPTVFGNAVDESGETSHYSGLEIDLINTLRMVMNFTIDFYEPLDAETEKWGRKVETANFTGLLGEIDSTRADIALGGLHYTMFNLEVMDLTIPYNTECLTFLVPELLSDNSWKTLILPFCFSMWIGVLISLGLIGILFFSFSNVYCIMNRKKLTAESLIVNNYFSKDFFDCLSSCILYTYSMILLVSLPRLPLRWSVRVLTGWWWVYSVLVVVAYRASLTSILANPQPRLTIDSLEALANSWVKCGVWGEQNRKFFLMSADPEAQKIGAKIDLIENSNDAIDRVAGGDFAYFENQYTLQQLRFNHEKEEKESAQNLHIMEQCSIIIPVSVGLEKNSPFKNQMDKYIRRTIEGGLVKKWLMNAIKSFESSIESQPEEAIMSLKKFYGALVALGCGYVLALLAFIIEKAYWKFVVERHPHYDKYYGKIIEGDQQQLNAN